MTDDPFSVVVKFLGAVNTPVVKTVNRYISDAVLDLSILTDNVHWSLRHQTPQSVMCIET